MAIEEYSAHSETFILRDRVNGAVNVEQLDFHVKSGDYFRMISAALGFVEETVQNCTCGLAPELVPLEVKTLRNIRDELEYLHERYTIVPQTKD